MAKKTIALIAYFFLSFLPFILNAQHPYFNHITTDQGLPSQTVYDIYQDKRGFIWVATENGIARYDGREFKRFSSPNFESLSLTNITEDDEGNIYANKFSGQVVKVSLFDTLSLVTTFKSNTFNYFGDYRFVDDDMIGCFGNSLLRYNMKSGKMEDITSLLDSANSPFFAMINDEKKGVIFDLDKTFYYYGKRKIKSIPVHQEVENLLKSSEAFAQIRYAKMGNVNVGIFLIQSSENGKYSNYFFEAAEDSVRPFRYKISKEFPHTEKIITVTFNAEGNKLFVHSINGCDYYKLNGDTFEFKQKYFPGILINKSLIDTEDNLWFSTLDKGIFMIPSDDTEWLLDRNTDIQSPRISRLSFYGENLIAVGFHNGTLLLLDKRNGKKVEETKISQLNIESMLYSKNQDRLFVGAGGLYGYRMNQPVVTYSRGSFKQIIESNSGFIYTVSNYSSQAYFFNPSKRENPYSDLPKREFSKEWPVRFETIKFMRGYSLAENENGNELWIAYKDGLRVHKPDTNLTIVNPENGEPFSITSLVSVKGNSIWAGSQNGIFIFNDGKLTQRLTTRNGLSGNEIRLMKNVNDTIWVLSDYGFNVISDNGKKIRRLSFVSSVFQNEIKDFLVDRQFLYMPVGNGIIRIPYRNLPEELPLPRIYISEIKKNGIVFNHYNENEMDYFERNIDISFSGLNFSSGNLLKYKYRLLGLDTNWTVADYHNTKVNFISLSPGHYTFEVKALNADGNESENAATYSFSIDRPWWTQVWFIAVCFVSFVLGLVLYIKQREDRILELSAQEQEKNILAGELRISQLSAIKAQMNPHFIFNALNSIQNSIFQHDHETANRYLGKFSDLMRMILKMSNEQTVSLDDELKALRLYLDLESIRFKDDFSYHIEVDPKIEKEWVRIPSMLIQPYVENAIKHGLLHKKTDCRLDIRLIYNGKDKVLDVEVEDNGVGREKSEEIKNRRSKLFQSFATGANQQRLELLNYGRSLGIVCEITDKKNESGEATGTLVRLRIPIDEETV